MARQFAFSAGEFYHLYNRGTDKRTIFTNSAERDRFVALLYLANQVGSIELKIQGSTLEEIQERGTAPLVNIVAYSLMPNHFHLLIQEIEDGGISKFMQKLQTGYTMYFNKRHERTGALFQGKFKATHVVNDRYLQYLISYIHLNPIKLIDSHWKENGISNREEAERYLESYRYSSYLDYLGKKRNENCILNTEQLPEYFSRGADFKLFVTEWLTYKPE